MANLFESQLFLDDTWIADSNRVGRVWHQPRKRAEPVLQATAAWEGIPVMFGSVLCRAGRFQMWYISWQGAYRGAIAYAESPDGIHWTKPALGLVDVDGRRDNNLLFARHDCYVDNLGVVDDPADRRWPLKMIYWTNQGRKPGSLCSARSADGIHWDWSLGTVLPGWGDRMNVMPARVDGKIVVLARDPGLVDRYGWRLSSRIESRDLVRWSKPELLVKQDPEDDPHLEIYSATAFRYESMYIGSIERMHMVPDLLDPELWFSHDSHVWHRTRPRGTFLERGPAGSWDGAWLCLPGSGPIRRNGELLFHYSGRACAHAHHDSYRVAVIGLASLRIDGFCSLQAVDREGWVETPPLRWVRGELHLNVDPRRDLTAHPAYDGGEVRVEVRDARNKPVRGYRFADCVPVTRNTAHRTAGDGTLPVEWNRGRKMAALAGRKIRLAFRLRDAHLYSFKARRP